MKNISSLVLALLFLIVLGCGCPKKLEEMANKENSSTPTSSPTKSSRSGSYDISMDKYNQIKDGTTRSEAERILGGPGTEVASTKAAGTTYATVKWEGEGYSSIILSFKDDKVYSRVQVGLK